MTQGTKMRYVDKLLTSHQLPHHVVLTSAAFLQKSTNPLAHSCVRMHACLCVACYCIVANLPVVGLVIHHTGLAICGITNGNRPDCVVASYLQLYVLHITC